MLFKCEFSSRHSRTNLRFDNDICVFKKLPLKRVCLHTNTKTPALRLRAPTGPKLRTSLSNFVESQIRTLLYPCVPINRFIQNTDSSETAGKDEWQSGALFFTLYTCGLPRPYIMTKRLFLTFFMYIRSFPVTEIAA